MPDDKLRLKMCSRGMQISIVTGIKRARQYSRRIAHLVALGQLAQHYVIRIVYNTLYVVNSVGPNSPHAMG
jgi:hypothetical protein